MCEAVSNSLQTVRRGILFAAFLALAIPLWAHTDTAARGHRTETADCSRAIPCDTVALRALRVEAIALVAAPPPEAQPAAILKFDVTNEALLPVTDVLLDVALLDDTDRDGSAGRPVKAIVGPFEISATAPIEGGYTVHYELLLRNLSVDCRCVPSIRVRSARSVTGEAR